MQDSNPKTVFFLIPKIFRTPNKVVYLRFSFFGVKHFLSFRKRKKGLAEVEIPNREGVSPPPSFRLILTTPDIPLRGFLSL